MALLPPISLPPHIITELDSWGPRVVAKLRRAKELWSKENGVGVSTSWPLVKVGTDCSGAEAPIWSLRAMGIQHHHVFSSDCADHARKFIKANCNPNHTFFDDMISRDHNTLPHHHIYVCGFPCKPFSMLHHGTKFFKEKAAAPFAAMLATVSATLPVLAVFENVPGLGRVMQKVLSAMRRKLRGYHMFVVSISPVDLGEPVRRPRFYFIAVRQDASLTPDICQMGDLLSNMLEAAKSHLRATCTQRMLPNSHPLVVKHLKVAKERLHCWAQKRGQQQHGRSPAWVRRHQQYKAKCATKSFKGSRSHGPSADDMLLAGDRVREAWSLAARGRGPTAVMDLSQNVDRAPVTIDGTTPTITPNGQILVAELRREMLPIEKLLLHGIPIHRARFPSELTDRNIASLGGNTMHVQCVGVALLCGMSLIKWDLPAVKMGATCNAVRPPTRCWLVGMGQPGCRPMPPASNKRKTGKARATPAKVSLDKPASTQRGASCRLACPSSLVRGRLGGRLEAPGEKRCRLSALFG